ncbi:MAG: EamA family transporter [Syntrophobacteraceae bacterium]
MLWLILTSCAALAVSTRDALIKKCFSDLNSYEMVLCPLLLGLPLFIAGWLLIEIPHLDTVFWVSCVAALPLEALALVLYMEAIRVSPLSLTIPFLAFTPVFILATGAIFLQETPNVEGICGTLITFVGGYVLNLNPSFRSLFYPFTAIARERGSWLMLLVAFIYSITSVLGKTAVLHSSPIFFALTYVPALTILLLILFSALKKVSWTNLRTRTLQGLVIGSLYLIESLAHCMALPLVKVAYMISIKRMGILVSVVYGGVLFREKHIFYRLMGACLMVFGAIVITIWGR